MIRTFCKNLLSIISILVLPLWIMGISTPLEAQTPIQFQQILTPDQSAAAGLHEIWQLPLVVDPNQNRIIAITPLDDAVYVLTSEGFLINIDKNAGTTRWRIQLPSAGVITSRPVDFATNEILIVSQGQVLILDSRTGKVVPGQSQTLSFAPGTNPLVGDGHIFIGGLNDSMYALSNDFPLYNIWFQLATGDSFTSDPVLVEDMLIFGSRSGMLWGKPAEDGQGGWGRQLGGAIIASPAATDENVYYPCMDGKVYAVEAASGIVSWATRLPGDLNLRPAAVDDNQVLVPTGGEGLFCLDAESGIITWGPVEHVDKVLAVIGSTVYAGTTDNDIKIINLKSGTVTATAALNGTMVFAPETSGNVFYVASEDGRVAALTPNNIP
ncbi:MAG TPA: PQQ-binding-like beta-propeller repeat protein [Phycisphaerae bacterium]|nr:PQQ-binding-like beta-propeller repeat protein [Phycisphaerae bacterium]